MDICHDGKIHTFRLFSNPDFFRHHRDVRIIESQLFVYDITHVITPVH